MSALRSLTSKQAVVLSLHQPSAKAFAAVGQLGTMYFEVKGVTPSWRRARELYKRAIGLGNRESVKNMQFLTGDIQAVC